MQATSNVNIYGELYYIRDKDMQEMYWHPCDVDSGMQGDYQLKEGFRGAGVWKFNNAIVFIDSLPDGHTHFEPIKVSEVHGGSADGSMN